MGVKTCVGGGLEISDCGRGSLTDDEEECLLIRFSSLACQQSKELNKEPTYEQFYSKVQDPNKSKINKTIHKYRIPISLTQTI